VPPKVSNIKQILMLFLQKTLYQAVTRVGYGLIRVAAIWQPKAREWVDGRRYWRARYAAQWAALRPAEHTLWVHVSSLGEFEQGRPLIEAWRAKHPDWRIVLTFFSPSGYTIRHDYAHADWVGYLPADTPANARDFVALVRPTWVVFVKYDFWAGYLLELERQRVRTILISALFRADQPFFRWYGGLWRRMLGTFNHIFVQNEASARLLQQIGIQQVTVAGDTRTDRVITLVQQARAQGPDAGVAAFFEANRSAPHAVVGSSWPPDEALWADVLARPEFAAWRLIIAPHTPEAPYVDRLIQSLKFPAVRLSTIRSAAAHADDLGQYRILVIDCIGLLNTLYGMGRVAHIGGGLGKGIHNTLEPAAWQVPITFGPNYQKFEEARHLIAMGGAQCVRHANDLAHVLRHWSDPHQHQQAADAIGEFLASHQGATKRIIELMR
jgi:3-deoxy-D-manno-octulosonic-acid transferase